MNTMRILPAALALATLAACSSAQPPKSALSQAQLAVQDASQGEASQFAALELQKAREKLDQARQAMDEKHYKQARRMAEEATLDAQLAQAKAQSQSSQNSAQQLRQSIDTLRQEIGSRVDTNSSGSADQNGSAGTTSGQ